MHAIVVKVGKRKQDVVPGALKELEVLGNVERKCLPSDLDIGVDGNQLRLCKVSVTMYKFRISIRTCKIENKHVDDMLTIPNFSVATRDSCNREWDTELHFQTREGSIAFAEYKKMSEAVESFGRCAYTEAGKSSVEAFWKSVL